MRQYKQKVPKIKKINKERKEYPGEYQRRKGIENLIGPLSKRAIEFDFRKSNEGNNIVVPLKASLTPTNDPITDRIRRSAPQNFQSIFGNDFRNYDRYQQSQNSVESFLNDNEVNIQRTYDIREFESDFFGNTLHQKVGRTMTLPVAQFQNKSIPYIQSFLSRQSEDKEVDFLTPENIAMGVDPKYRHAFFV